MESDMVPSFAQQSFISICYDYKRKDLLQFTRTHVFDLAFSCNESAVTK